MAWVRLLAVPFAVLEVRAAQGRLPARVRGWAWALALSRSAPASCCGLRTAFRRGRGAGSVSARSSARHRRRLRLRPRLLLRAGDADPAAGLHPADRGCAPLRDRRRLAMSAVSACLLAFTEWWRRTASRRRSSTSTGSFSRSACRLILGLVVGSLVERLRAERRGARARVARPRRFATSSVAARTSSTRPTGPLVRSDRPRPDQAFAAFIRELRGLIRSSGPPLSCSKTEACACSRRPARGSDSVFPPERLPRSKARSSRTSSTADGRSTATTCRSRRTSKPTSSPSGSVRASLRPSCPAPRRSARSPSSVRARCVQRRRDRLLGLLRRLVGSAIQNIRAYEAERTTVEELRRLSALRADFVSLVSHELRSPMASVIGSARTLEQRWRELSPEQRESFLALIAHETSRLAELIGDVLDVEDRVRHLQLLVRGRRPCAARAGLGRGGGHGQDEAVEAVVREPLPAVGATATASGRCS